MLKLLNLLIKLLSSIYCNVYVSDGSSRPNALMKEEQIISHTLYFKQCIPMFSAFEERLL